MINIEVVRASNVPDGEYCARYGVGESEKCSQIRSRTDYIDRSSGLGSSGSITFHSCALFDIGLSEAWGVSGVPGMSLKKCAECITKTRLQKPSTTCSL